MRRHRWSPFWCDLVQACETGRQSFYADVEKEMSVWTDYGTMLTSTNVAPWLNSSWRTRSSTVVAVALPSARVYGESGHRRSVQACTNFLRILLVHTPRRRHVDNPFWLGRENLDRTIVSPAQTHEPISITISQQCVYPGPASYKDRTFECS